MKKALIIFIAGLVVGSVALIAFRSPSQIGKSSSSGFLSELNIATHPTIILISIDTLRADHLSLYGYERKTSPFLDSLGRRFTFYTRAFSQATWTLPSHWSMLTGLYSSQHGIFQDGRIVLMITSDHGESFSENRKNFFRFHHGGMPYDEQCHVPLIITVPGGQKDGLIAAGVDIMPTALELAGKSIPSFLPGKSLLNIGEGTRSVLTEALHRYHSFGMRSDLTYIKNKEDLEIYLPTDVKESNNLLDRESKKTKAIPQELQDELKALGYLR